ncbi:MAG: efflux RND transporter periplasmic adaptor subunit [Acidobacteria bacterium]|nr:efflux RND transporter periplasmic adaptor subunit [Acidobacteriota bacterium]
MSRSKLIVVVIAMVVVAAGVFYVVGRGPSGADVELGTVTEKSTFTSTVTASGEIVATRYADIGSSVMGKIVALPVREGDRVTAGQVLARIDAVPAQSDATSASEQVNALLAEERAAGELVKSAQSDLTLALSRERDVKQQLSRVEALFRDGLVPASEHDAAKIAVESAAAQVASARAAIVRVTETQGAASRRIAQARAQQRRADDTLAKTSIVSPIAGIVSRLRVREGEMVVVGLQNQPGTTLMTISDLAEIDAEVKVAEADVLRLAIGQPSTVTLEAVPGRVFTGTVAEIGASALPVSGAGAAAREFKVVVRLAQPDSGLRPGLTCDAEIVTSQRTNVLTVPLQSVVLRPDAKGVDATGVFVVNNGVAVFTPVKTGVIGGLDIEVSGVSTGVSLVVGPYQVLRTLQDGAVVKAAKSK